jgi:hypothetical protein
VKDMAFMSPMTGYPTSWPAAQVPFGQFQPQGYSGDLLGQTGQPSGGQLGGLIAQLGRILSSGTGIGGGQQYGGGQQFGGTQPFGVAQQYQPQDVWNIASTIAAAIAPLISSLIARGQVGGMQGYGLQALQQFQPQGQMPQLGQLGAGPQGGFGQQVNPQLAAVLQLLGAAVTQAQQAQGQGQGMQGPGQRPFPVGV